MRVTRKHHSAYSDKIPDSSGYAYLVQIALNSVLRIFVLQYPATMQRPHIPVRVYRTVPIRAFDSFSTPTCTKE